MRGIASISTRGGHCEKPSCAHHSARVSRHHKGHESLWFSAWHSFRGRMWWTKLVARYYKFLPTDIVYLCHWHHAEIHYHYDRIIVAHCLLNERALYLFTRPQCEALVAALRAYCDKWIHTKSAGRDPKRYERTKKARRTRLRRAMRSHTREKLISLCN